MEAQDNKQLALRKAINMHKEAEASLADLAPDGPDPRYSKMMERIRSNLAELQAEAETGDPADLV